MPSIGVEAGQFVNAAIVLVIAAIDLPSPLLTIAMGTAGFLGGMIAPSRHSAEPSASKVASSTSASGSSGAPVLGTPSAPATCEAW